MNSKHDDDKLKVHVMKAQAVRTAMAEVVSENRAEIIRRARAKLTAMGIALSAEELGEYDEPQIP